MISTLVYGNFNILKFYLKTIPLISEISKNGQGFETDVNVSKLEKPKKFVLDNKLAENYNKEYNEMKDKLKQTHKDSEAEFSTKMQNFFILRLICCVLAYFDYFYLTILISSLQFFILPYSLIISLSKFIEILYNIFLGYLIYFPIAYSLTNNLNNVNIFNFLSIKSIENTDNINFKNNKNIFNLSLEINNEFICYFFLVDFLVCSVFSFYTPLGKTKQFKPARLAQSIIYGFLNTKTYYLILLFLLRGAKIPILLWLIDAIFKVSEKLTFLMHQILKINWPMVFYHQHRVAHFPYVYSDAHKFHHFLQDSSPFDAHLYGSGAPEEWHSLMFELLPCFFLGLFPPSLSFFALKNSLLNKIGHTRKENGNDQELSHVDHHLFHIKNFSWDISLEMFLGTSTNNRRMKCDGYVITKEIEGDKSIFTYEKASNQ